MAYDGNGKMRKRRVTGALAALLPHRVQVWYPAGQGSWLDCAGATGPGAFCVGYLDGIKSEGAPLPGYDRLRYRIVSQRGHSVPISALRRNSGLTKRDCEVRIGGTTDFRIGASGPERYCAGWAAGFCARFPHPAVRIVRLETGDVIDSWEAASDGAARMH